MDDSRAPTAPMRDDLRARQRALARLVRRSILSFVGGMLVAAATLLSIPLLAPRWSRTAGLVVLIAVQVALAAGAVLIILGKRLRAGQIALRCTECGVPLAGGEWQAARDDVRCARCEAAHLRAGT